MSNFLSKSQRQELYVALKATRDVRFIDRIRTILLLDQGESYEEIAKFLFIDRRTAERYKRAFQKEGLESLISMKYRGGLSYLSSEEQEELKLHLSKNLYRTLQEIRKYVLKAYNVWYSVRGLGQLLQRLGFVYKKPSLVPGKANRQAQEEFVKKLESLKDSEEPLYFADGVHPQHNTYANYGWILKGEEFELKSNTKRYRLNINGAINAQDSQGIVIDNAEAINAQSTIRLLKKIERRHPKAMNINVVVDNAAYYRSRLVKEYLENSRITLVFLPPYSPNLNLIERLWKVLNRMVLYNIYYEKFEDFREAILGFFQNRKKYRDEIDRSLSFKFQTIGT